MKSTKQQVWYCNAKTSTIQTIFRFLLGLFLFFAGIGHLSWSSVEFLAQVPDWLPLDADLVVVLSGIVEIVLGISLILLSKQKAIVGWVVAIFFVLIFPGNISQWMNGVDAFGLDSDTSRAIRLLFQPLLIVWALWSTGAWRAFRNRK